MMDVENLRELLGRVTPGPWVYEPDDGFAAVRVADTISYKGVAYLTLANYANNAALIAMAPELAAEVLRLTAERDAAVAETQHLVARVKATVAEALREIDRQFSDTLNGHKAKTGLDTARAFLAGEGGK